MQLYMAGGQKYITLGIVETEQEYISITHRRSYLETPSPSVSYYFHPSYSPPLFNSYLQTVSPDRPSVGQPASQPQTESNHSMFLPGLAPPLLGCWRVFRCWRVPRCCGLLGCWKLFGCWRLFGCWGVFVAREMFGCWSLSGCWAVFGYWSLSGCWGLAGFQGLGLGQRGLYSGVSSHLGADHQCGEWHGAASTSVARVTEHRSKVMKE